MGIYLQLLGEAGRSLTTEPRTLAHALQAVLTFL